MTIPLQNPPNGRTITSKILPLRSTVAALVAAMLASTGGLQAASDTYTGAAGDNVFDNGVNWASGTAPGDITAGATTNTDTATFALATGAAITMTVQRNLQSLALTGGGTAGFAIGATTGPAFVLTSGGSIASSGGSVAVNAPLILANAAATTSGAYTFDASTPGTTRVTTIGGTVTGSATGTGVTTLTLQGNSTTANTLNGVISNGTGGGTLAIVKTGTGQWQFNNAANTFSGGLTVTQGTARMNTSGNTTTTLGTGTITFNGGTVLLGSTGATTLNNALVANAGTTSFLSQRGNDTLAPTSFTGTGNLTIAASSATAVVSSFTNLQGFAGTLEVANLVTLRAITGINQATLAATSLIIDAGGTFTENIGTNNANQAVTIGSLAGSGTIGGSAAGAGFFNYTVGGNNASTTFSGTIIAGGTGTALTKTGTGTLTLTGANTYTGITTITGGGTLNINGINALGGGNYGGLTINGGTLQYNAAGGALNGSSDISNIGGTAKNVTISGAATFDTNGNDVTFANTIGNGGAGNVIKTGAGVLTFAAANTYTGGTNVMGGALTAAINAALSTGNVTLANGTTLTLATGVTDAIANSATLTLGTGAGANATLALNGTNGTAQETVNGLMVNGVALPAGTYGALTDTSVTAAFRIPQITGTGELIVLTLAVVPEPSTWVMMLGGLGGLGALVIRRKRCA